MFKGCKVYAKVDESGNLLARDGRVTIKYQPHQDQEYQARADAVREIDKELLKKGSYPKKTKKAPSQGIGASRAWPRDKEDRSIIIYADGACKGNPGPAGIGIVLQYRGHRKEISRFIGLSTNNRAELSAIRAALKEIRNPTVPVYLHTDSAYCYGILVDGWKPKQNKQIIEDIQKEMTRFSNLAFIKVEGHAGIEGNERADQLAREAIAKNAPSDENMG